MASTTHSVREVNPLPRTSVPHAKWFWTSWSQFCFVTILRLLPQKSSLDLPCCHVFATSDDSPICYWRRWYLLLLVCLLCFNLPPAFNCVSCKDSKSLQIMSLSHSRLVDTTFAHAIASNVICGKSLRWREIGSVCQSHCIYLRCKWTVLL